MLEGLIFGLFIGFAGYAVVYLPNRLYASVNEIADTYYRKIKQKTPDYFLPQSNPAIAPEYKETDRKMK